MTDRGPLPALAELEVARDSHTRNAAAAASRSRADFRPIIQADSRSGDRLHPVDLRRPVDLSRPLRFGHRGFSAIAPENTLAAFERVLQTDAPGVELDVRLSADGIPVIHHDSDLRRTAGIPARVDALPLTELRKAPVGAWFGRGYETETLPALEDLFELAGRRLYYDIELKEERPLNKALCLAVGRLIHGHGLQGHVLVSSFNPFVLAQFGRHFPSVPRAAIYSHHKEVPRPLRGGLGNRIASTSFSKPHFQMILPAAAHPDTASRHRPVLAWTVNDPSQATELAAAGVWGYCTDDPESVRPSSAR